MLFKTLTFQNSLKRNKLQSKNAD